MNHRSLPGLLEEGALDFPGARALALAWETLSAKSIARPLVIPKGARVFTVGGATLGGSGKTPLAIALARALGERGERVALVGHGYGARPGRARRVRPGDDVREVGDEALLAARHLEGTRAVVVIADRRDAAVEMAASLARTIVLDGPLQTKPARAYRSLLAVDAEQPWGSGLHPPRGDLRAPPAALVAASDLVVAIGERPSGALLSLGARALPLSARLVSARRLSPAGQAALSLEALSGARVGLLLGLARPRRFLSALAKAEIHPVKLLRFLDHRLPSPRFLREAATFGAEARLDAWIATEKCATRLPDRIGAVPVVAIEQRLDLTETELNFIDAPPGKGPKLP